jgi:hypothetical protein
MFVRSSVVLREGLRGADNMGSLMQDLELGWDTGYQPYFFFKIPRRRKKTPLTPLTSLILMPCGFREWRYENQNATLSLKTPLKRHTCLG